MYILQDLDTAIGHGWLPSWIKCRCNIVRKGHFYLTELVHLRGSGESKLGSTEERLRLAALQRRRLRIVTKGSGPVFCWRFGTFLGLNGRHGDIATWDFKYKHISAPISLCSLDVASALLAIILDLDQCVAMWSCFVRVKMAIDLLSACKRRLLFTSISR